MLCQHRSIVALAVGMLVAGAVARTAAAPEQPRPDIVLEKSPQPAIHGPRITGSTPGRPFLFSFPPRARSRCTSPPRTCPEGLALDAKTGIITGSLTQAGTTEVAIAVENALGKAQGKLTIVGGAHKLALTPPMGWNSWNCWASAVSDAKVRAAADAMVKSGLAAHGFQYVNIDDCWEGQRDAKGEIHSNEKFPDMKALADYVHSKGLKLGIYSSPGPEDLRRLRGKLEARGSRTPTRMPSGASITSSTTGAPTANVEPASRSGGPDEALRR